MYYTVHMRLSTARTRDKKEMAQNGTKWHLQNKEKARRRMDMRFPVLTCATQPGEALNVTITSQMHQNASDICDFIGLTPPPLPSAPPQPFMPPKTTLAQSPLLPRS